MSIRITLIEGCVPVRTLKWLYNLKNPPLSQTAKVLTKIALEGARVALCTPKWGPAKEHAYCMHLLDRITVGTTELSEAPIHVHEDSQDTMAAPEWGSFLSIVDGSLNPILVCIFEPKVVKEMMAENRGLTLLDLKKGSEYSSITTTSSESYNNSEAAGVSPPVADADDHLSEIASSIPVVTPELLTMKQSAFVAQLFMEEVDLEHTNDGSHDHALFLMWASDGFTGRGPGAQPSPNNMPVSEHDV